MAYHFRKVRNTLRLFPTAKTFGFSTRANEGDSATVTGCSERCTATSSTRQSQSGLMDLGNIGQPIRGISRSQSDPDLTHNLLPAIFTSPANALPVSYSDLAQILRLPAPVPNGNKDLSSDGASILKAVRPTCDDILAESWALPAHKSSGFETGSFTKDSPNRTHEWIPLEVLESSHTMRQIRTPPMSALNPFSDNDIFANHSVMNTFTSNNAHHHHHFSMSGSDPTGSPGQSSPMAGSSQGKSSGPTPEQMHNIKEKLEKMVCKMFSGRLDYSVLHKNVVLENNLFGSNKTCVGLLAYGMEMLKLRLRTHARFSNVSVELQSVTMLEQNGVIRIHWRLKGLSQIQTLKFWRIFQSKRAISKDDFEWHDAFSYFHIGKDGMVHKHRIDKMIPDDASGKDKITETLRGLLTPAKPLVS